jgi:hypothetical protein
MIKKNATLTEFILGMMLVIGVFVGLFLWYQSNMQSAGVNIDNKYNNTYTNLYSKINETDSVINEIVTASNNLREADSIYAVAINGIKGLMSVLLLPIKFISIAENSIVSFLTILEIPSWVKAIILISIVTVIVLILVGIFKGEPKT